MNENNLSTFVLSTNAKTVTSQYPNLILSRQPKHELFVGAGINCLWGPGIKCLLGAGINCLWGPGIKCLLGAGINCLWGPGIKCLWGLV